MNNDVITGKEKRVENWLDSLEEKRDQENQLMQHREKQYEEMLKADQIPLVLRLDHSTRSTLHFDSDKKDKTEKFTSIQFLPHLYARDEVNILENWLGKGNVKIIFVSRETFFQVSDASRREKFAVVYDEKGWNGIARRCLSADNRNELLQKAMNVIEGNSFHEEKIE